MVFRRLLCRVNATALSASACRQNHTLKKEKQKSGPSAGSEQLSPEVISFLESPEYDEVRGRLPRSLLKKYRTPETMYLINRATARQIVDTIGSSLHADAPLLEVNPGMGVLTEELLKSQKNDVYLYEMSAQCSQFLKKLENKYPDRIHYKTADFFGMWKLSFLDKMDNGSRMKSLLGDLAKKNNNGNFRILGAMPSLNFIKHLMFTIVFHNTASVLGRPDLYIAMPSFNYAYLKDDGSTLQKKVYRSTPTLFQILFDFKCLAKVPRSHFLPWQYPQNRKKGPLMDEDYMYIVNIKQKEQLPCDVESLPLLWYFLRPHILCHTTRVIPSLEQWIPGCGVWLISGQDPPDTNKARAPGPSDAPLPHMTIFTQYGDLSIPQKVTIFKRFISWPEFEQCLFRVTMENNLPKTIAGIDEKDLSASAATIDDTEENVIEEDVDDEKHSQ